jgi:MFS transporter, MHS family, proline/betaine transporter
MKHCNRIMFAGMIGNLIEAFDMAIGGLLSVYLAKYLIGDTAKGLLMIFATFFTGYLARPLGAFALGLFSDAYGRKITLAASIISMGIATTAIGFIPSRESIGVSAWVILLVLRVVQSFSCGAEYLNSSAYLVENAEESHKGYSGSWASFGCAAGLLLASIVTLGVTAFISYNPEAEWIIWRVPFIFALLGSSIGLYIRFFIPESLEYILYYSEQPKPKVSKVFKEALCYFYQNKLRTIHVFVLSALGVTTTFMFYIYGPTQAHIYGTFSDNQIILSNIFSLMMLLVVMPLAGRLSDRLSQEKMVLISALGFLGLSQPFLFILSYGTFAQFIVIQCLISVPSAIYCATVPVMLTKMFPINLRCTVLSVLYSSAASLSAGLTPLLSLILLKKTHTCTAPALLVGGLVVVTILTMSLKVMKNKKWFNLIPWKWDKTSTV